MKTQSLLGVLLLVLIPALTYADALPGTIETAKAVKAIYDKGFAVCFKPSTTDVETVTQVQTPDCD